MSLWQQYLEKKEKAEGPYFPKQAAEEMGISEGALIADAPDTIYLGANVRDLVLKLDTLGEILSVVRNDVAVHEKSGLYEHVTLTARSGLALNVGGIDLRFFLQNWHHALAVVNTINDKTRHSIQFYDEFGVAIEKVFLKDESKVPAWQALVDEFKTEGKPEFIHTERPAAPVPQPLSAERETAFQERWLELKDVHHFGGLLETFELDRQQSYRHAPAGMTKQLDNSVWQQVLEQARDSEMKIMIFVGNRGLVQIQTGQVHNLKRAYGYLNILDNKEPEQFDLHLRDDAIVETWLVRRPISEGYVTCVEGFDQYRQSVIQIFGFRSEGDDEMTAWHKLTDELFA